MAIVCDMCYFIIHFKLLLESFLLIMECKSCESLSSKVNWLESLDLGWQRLVKDECGKKGIKA